MSRYEIRAMGLPGMTESSLSVLRTTFPDDAVYVVWDKELGKRVQRGMYGTREQAEARIKRMEARNQ